jgi:hypothetical protein
MRSVAEPVSRSPELAEGKRVCEVRIKMKAVFAVPGPDDGVYEYREIPVPSPAAGMSANLREAVCEEKI